MGVVPLPPRFFFFFLPQAEPLRAPAASRETGPPSTEAQAETGGPAEAQAETGGPEALSSRPRRRRKLAVVFGNEHRGVSDVAKVNILIV